MSGDRSQRAEGLHEDEVLPRRLGCLDHLATPGLPGSQVTPQSPDRGQLVGGEQRPGHVPHLPVELDRPAARPSRVLELPAAVGQKIGQPEVDGGPQRRVGGTFEHRFDLPQGADAHRLGGGPPVDPVRLSGEDVGHVEPAIVAGR